MLQLTKRAEYGLIALVHLVGQRGEYVSAREISDHYPVPRRLLAEVLKELCRAGLLDSQRGATGGYALSRPAERISLGEVVTALEGAPAVTGCENLGAYVDGSCDVESVCPIRSPLQTLRSGLWNLLQCTSLRDLAAGSIAPAPASSEEKSGPAPASAAAPHAPTIVQGSIVKSSIVKSSIVKSSIVNSSLGQTDARARA